jgi:hypothetical protein
VCRGFLLLDATDFDGTAARVPDDEMGRPAFFGLPIFIAVQRFRCSAAVQFCVSQLLLLCVYPSMRISG